MPELSVWPVVCASAIANVMFGIGNEHDLLIWRPAGAGRGHRGLDRRAAPWMTILHREAQMLNRISLALVGMAGAVVSVPILAYLLEPLIQSRPSLFGATSVRSTDFIVGKNGRGFVRGSLAAAWAGQTALSRGLAAPHQRRTSLSSRSTARILAAQ